MRKDVDSQTDSIKNDIVAEVASDIDDINAKLSSIACNSSVTAHTDISCNIIIRNLPHRDNENTRTKVNSLIRDGLNINTTQVLDAERKRSVINKPGVIVATFQSNDDKNVVMRAKRKLKRHEQYAHVCIDHDQSKSDRIMTDNFRAILSALKQHDSNLSIEALVLLGALIITIGSNSSSMFSAVVSLAFETVAMTITVSLVIVGEMGRTHVTGLPTTVTMDPIIKVDSRPKTGRGSRVVPPIVPLVVIPDSIVRSSPGTFWNVHGWMAACESDNFILRTACIEHMVRDTIGIAETHLTQNEPLHVPGYQ